MKFLLPFLVCVASALAAAVPPTPTTLPGAETFAYREGEASMLLHVFKPVGWKATDRRPALVFFFGGGWNTGTPEKSAGWARFAAKNGMVGIAPDYRTRQRFNTSPLESVADSRAALRWVQDHAAELGIDVARIAVGGNSAGGHVALWTAIATTPPGSSPREAPLTQPAALLLFSAVSDTSMLAGYTPRRFGEHATALSPLHQLDSKMPPTLAFHGDADKTVPFSQAVALGEKYQQTNNSYELVVVPGGSHAFSTDLPEWRTKAQSMARDFLARHGLIGTPAR